MMWWTFQILIGLAWFAAGCVATIWWLDHNAIRFTTDLEEPHGENPHPN